MTTNREAEQPQEEGVLAGLDSQVTTSFYWYLAVLSCIGGSCSGTTPLSSVRSWTSSRTSYPTSRLDTSSRVRPSAPRWALSRPGR